jgi:membrane protease YdiL (CAAX protease family)
MLTTIGRQLHDSPRNLALASVVGVFAIATDLALVWWDHYPVSIEGRGAVALVGLAAYFYLVRGDLASVGLTVTTAQGWRYWIRATFLIGLAVAGLIVLGLGLWVLLGHELPVYTTPPRAFGVSFLHMCVFAPILEEATYRLLICVPLAGWRRPWLAIAASGLAFGGLHLVYGNPSPENLLGGLFLAWAYLKSGTICVSVLLHSFGNLCALVGQIGAWYWLAGAA